MTDSEANSIAVRTIREEFSRRNIDIQKIVLFGSRAKGIPRSDSDWDFIVITKESLTRKNKVEAQLAVISKLAKSMIDVELIVKDQETVDKQRNNIGCITHYALEDGIEQ
jgi:predicted nucleotidyltransferase